ILGDWLFIHSSTQIITNRVAPYHRDRSSPISFHNMLLMMETYEEQAVMDLWNLGVSVPYELGTMLSLAARLVSHGAPMCHADCICYAQFAPLALCEKFPMPLPYLLSVQFCIVRCLV
ncbi:hypothetical protein LXA43DRAFT_877771, partial [Ganoderma leucocontextum]